MKTSLVTTVQIFNNAFYVKLILLPGQKGTKIREAQSQGPIAQGWLFSF